MSIAQAPAANQPPRELSGVTIFAMALACGLAVANIYYNQPMLATMERQFGGHGPIEWVPTATQFGYALGLFLLVPLGDLLERRRLIVIQFLALGVTLVGAAIAPDAWTLVAASFLIGLCATVAQQILPLAASLSPAASRGRIIGKVMSGLLCGILFSRTLSGFVATHWGWREMFWISTPLAAMAALIMAFALPHSPPTSRMRYAELMRSLGDLWLGQPALRLAAYTQAALFASFISFWTILSLHLEEPMYRLGADVAGLFGIVGAVGVLAAPLAGNLADRRGPQLVIAIGALVTLGSWLLFGLWSALAGLIIGVILLDFGVQSALVSHQHLIYALQEDARSRLNTLFMSGMFVGGSIGSIASMIAWRHGGWRMACACGAAFASVAVITQLFSARRQRQSGMLAAAEQARWSCR